MDNAKEFIKILKTTLPKELLSGYLNGYLDGVLMGISIYEQNIKKSSLQEKED